MDQATISSNYLSRRGYLSMRDAKGPRSSCSKHMLHISKVLYLAAMIAGSSCANPSPTTVQLAVTFPDELDLDQLRITPAAPDINALPEPQHYPPVSDAASDAAAVPASGPAAAVSTSLLKSGLVIILQLPDTWERELATITVHGLSKGVLQALGANQVVVEKQQNVMLSVLLSAPCKSTCMAGASQCVNDLVRFCRKDAQGCASWNPPERCRAETPYCSNGRCAAVCEDECATAGQRRCTEDTTSDQGGPVQSFQECGQHDSDTCLDWGPEISCGAELICHVDNSQCVPGCDGKPCPCKAGENQVCADVGECSGGLSTCQDEQFGPCDWQVSPGEEACDGKDNDCNHHPDDGLVAPACENQQGVCKSAAKSCGGSQGWLPCGASEFTAQATSQGFTYEVNETLCDGQDNDCDGQTDEHQSCPCQPMCQGSFCGTSDGCGGTCQDGVCYPNAHCQQGECACSHVTCAGNCCGPEQVCKDGACCTPQCGGHVCGVESICGSSCGTCNTGEHCRSDGICMVEGVYSDCTEAMDGELINCGEFCQERGQQCAENCENNYSIHSWNTLEGCLNPGSTSSTAGKDCGGGHWRNGPAWFRCCCVPL